MTHPEAPKPLPWERQTDEPPRAFLAFTKYRDLAVQQRTVLRALELYTGRSNPEGYKAPGYFSRWATTFHWVRRSMAWDDERDRAARQAQMDADAADLAAMRKRHIGAALSLQTLAAEALKTRLDKARNAGDLITAHAMIRAMVEGTKIERVARGEPETIIHTTGISDPAGTPPAVQSDTDSLILRIVANPDARRAARDLAIALNRETMAGKPSSDSAPSQ